ncbi:30S ribosomal protein S5 [Candidatus Saccharibacteria bacterium]|nr:30S ribosomal protein S5 [Candidatus Saccharibacteria bacterium]
MSDETAATRKSRDIAGRPFDRRNDRRRGRVKADVAPKEYDEVTINIDRVSRTVAGGRRMRFKALVVIGNHKNKVGIGVAKGNDVTSAVQKASSKAKKNLITFAMDGETICHEVESKVTGADVLMKPAAPGTGIIAGGVVRSIIGLTGVKNLISKSLGSTNKVNIAYAVIEGLRAQVPRKEWETTKAKASEKPAAKPAAKAAKKVTAEKKTATTKKATTTKKASAAKKTSKKEDK